MDTACATSMPTMYGTHSACSFRLNLLTEECCLQSVCTAAAGHHLVVVSTGAQQAGSAAMAGLPGAQVDDRTKEAIQSIALKAAQKIASQNMRTVRLSRLLQLSAQ